MKSYKEITYRYLKGQRNRTLLTILGIILSVAMISAIGTIIVSTRGALIKQAIRENGSYHAKFMNVEKDNIERILNHVEVGESGVSKFEGSGIVRETTEEEREMYGDISPYRYIDIEGYKEEALNMLPYKIKEGRFPKTSDEIAIEPLTAKYFEKEVKIGDKINLTIGDRKFIEDENSNEDDIKVKEIFEKNMEKEYTVVGFIQPQYIWSGRFVTTGITSLDENSPKTGQFNVYIKVPNVKNAQEKINSIANDIGKDIEEVQFNNRVLRLYAESLDKTFNKAMVVLLVFVVLLIVVSTIAVIYNAFNISVLERISQFGLLRSVGATPQQIRGIVLKEAFILSIIGIPIGLFSGVLAMKIVLYVIGLLKSNIEIFNDMEITISTTVFLISSIVGLITVFLSAIGPAKRAEKISPLEAVRNTGSFKKESFSKVKKSGFIRKLLGLEGEIAYKNLRRNKKRFLITVFSMVISISLFITFSSFSNFMFKMGLVEGKDIGDFMIYGRGSQEAEKIYKKLKGIEGVNRVYKVRNINGDVLLSENKISKKNKEMQPREFNYKKDGLVQVSNANMYTIGDENFHMLKKLLNEGTIDIEALEKENGVLVINNTYVYNDKTEKQSLIEGYHLKLGDKFLYKAYESNEEDEEIKYNELKVMGVLEKGILDMSYNSNGSISIITTEKVWKNVIDENREYVRMYVELEEDGNIETVRKHIKEIESENPEFNYVDFIENAKQNRIAGIVINIFLYGFVAIITLISSINIINTISTNIILRTREISMIKAVGMAQGGIKRMVALESLFYGIYAAIFGGAIGTGLTFILFKIVFNIREFEWAIPWKNIGIACVGATIIALLSGAFPLRRINEGIIVENMKMEE
ncbi:ABC transporter permease [Tissierella sp. MSJ-40]|uniref:ABC transporter permease n=1 Tax=Tissierella simiarum TaxID=2841534 RepID=A0ABS6EAZ4_9FIRM|nr:ABC transporter permease [Tissierella simiarum]